MSDRTQTEQKTKIAFQIEHRISNRKDKKKIKEEKEKPTHTHKHGYKHVVCESGTLLESTRTKKEHETTHIQVEPLTINVFVVDKTSPVNRRSHDLRLRIYGF